MINNNYKRNGEISMERMNATQLEQYQSLKNSLLQATSESEVKYFEEQIHSFLDQLGFPR
ncbi:hypothetical protein ACIQLG_16450 [Terribacillus saccharophilus]|uniref:hypothetical protein n=1 Tax=Terribacillus saccharophilus TaxID=361277 RepID=UPI003824E05D